MQPAVIHKDGDICCRNCGSVLDHGDVSEITVESKPMSMELYILGSALQKNVNARLQKTAQQYHEENALRLISNIVKKYDLPEAFITDVFLYLKRKNHLQSEKEPIKYLIKILSKDENYIHINKMRAIKARYASIL